MNIHQKALPFLLLALVVAAAMAAPPDAGFVLSTEDSVVHAVKGRVVDTEGEPVLDAVVTLVSTKFVAGVFTGKDGLFSLEVEDGLYTLVARRPDALIAKLEKPVTVAGGSVEGLEIGLVRGASVSGRILGLPLESPDYVQLSVETLPHGLVNLDRTYRIDSLAPGDWQVAIQHGVERLTQRVTVRPGQQSLELDFPFSLGDLTLSGRVVADRPHFGVFVQLQRSGNPDLQSFTGLNAAKPAFQFRNLRPGCYLLIVTDEHSRIVLEREIDLSANLDLVIPLEGHP